MQHNTQETHATGSVPCLVFDASPLEELYKLYTTQTQILSNLDLQPDAHTHGQGEKRIHITKEERSSNDFGLVRTPVTPKVSFLAVNVTSVGARVKTRLNAHPGTNIRVNFSIPRGDADTSRGFENTCGRHGRWKFLDQGTYVETEGQLRAHPREKKRLGANVDVRFIVSVFYPPLIDFKSMSTLVFSYPNFNGIG